MDIKELLARVIVQNETIIRQNVELLLVLGVLAEEHSKGGTELDRSSEVGKKPPSDDGCLSCSSYPGCLAGRPRIP